MPSDSDIEHGGEQFYRQALDNMPAQLAVFDSEGRYLYVTPSAVADPEVREWLVGRDDFEYCRRRGIDQSVAQRRHDILKKVASSGEQMTFEESFTTRDGTNRHFMRFVSPVFDDSGTVVQVLGYGLDITARRQAEHALEESEQRYRGLVEEARDMIYQTDPDGNFTYANPVVYEILGYTAEQIIGRHFSELVLESHQASVRDFYANQLETGLKSSYLEFPVVDANGQTHWLGQNVRLVHDGKQFLGVSALARDITEWKATEAALIESDRRKAAIVSTALDCIITINDQGTIIEWNPAAEETFGFTAESAIGQTLADLIIPPTLREAHTRGMEHYKKTGEGPVLGNRIEISAIRASGEEFPVELAITPIKSGDRELFTAYVRDITDRKKSEQTLLEAKSLAEQSARAKEMFLASMSHEIRTPINAIVGMLHLLEESDLTQPQNRYVEAVQFSADALLGLVDEVLDLTKIEAGVIEPQLEVFSLPDRMRELVQSLRPRAEQKGLALELQISDGVPSGLRGDPLRTAQIVSNLVTNAIKYSDDGSISVQVDVQSEDAETIEIALSVEDEGRGIPADMLESVFEQFTQIGDSETGKNPGVGLGLAIVKRLIQILGGSISVTSEVGRGSRFHVVLPFVAAELQTKAVRHSSSGVSLDGVSILVAEDNPMNQMLMQELLSRWGADVTIAEDGEAALKAIESENYHLILMDIQMPKMNGYEATRLIRTQLGKSENDLPIIALTASAIVEQRQKALDVGMNAFVSKPFVPRELRRLLEEYVGVVIDDEPEVPNDVPRRVNKSFLLEQTLGNPELAVKVVDLFVKDAKATVQEITTGNVDNERIRFLSHRLKSSAGSVGARHFADTLEQLEGAADRSDNDVVRLLSEDIDGQLTPLLREIELVRAELVK